MRVPLIPSVLSALLLSVFAALPALAASAAAQAAAGASSSTSLRHLGRTELPGYTGDFDHFATDVKGNRLFLAAEDHSTLEVFELSTGKHLKSIRGFETPHNVLYLPDRNRIVVIDSGAGLSKVVDASSYKIVESIELAPGADSMTYDPSGKVMYVVSGGKNGKMTTSFLSKINPRSGENLGEIKFETDKVEMIAVEQQGPRIYVNVTGLNFVAVIDKKKFAVVETWPVTGAEMNAPMALDEANHRLFIVTRKPFKLMVLDTKTGAKLATFDAPNRTNEIMFDKATRRIYLAGDDYITVYQQNDPDHYTELERVPTAVGAKTAILVPEIKRMFVAQSSGEAKTGAAVLRFDVLPAAAQAR
jgi:DNA-binding beta-propeller fold protein YncE